MTTQLGHAGPLHLRLFIENVEVPVVGAVVAGSEGSPATAQIQLVPSNSGLNLASRSKILLFFLDPDAEDPSSGTTTPDDPVPDLRYPEMAGYYLLFSGELISLYFSKTSYGSRSLTIQCLDDSNMWNTSFLYLLRYSADAQQSVVAGNQSNFFALSQNNGNPLDDILNSPEQVIRQIAIRQKALSKAIAGTQGLLAGVLGVLELLGGVPGRFIGVTAWHTIQEARVRLMDQIATDSGSTSSELFDITAFSDWLTNRIGDAGTVISFRQIIDLINTCIYYTVAPNPVGVYRAGDRNPPTWPPELIAQLLAFESPSDLDPTFKTYVDAILTNMVEVFKWDGSTPDRPRCVVSSTIRSREEQLAVMKGTARADEMPFSAHMFGYAADFSPTGVGREFGFVYLGPPKVGGTLHQRLMYYLTRENGLPRYSNEEDFYAACKKGDSMGEFLTKEEIRVAKIMTAFYRDLKAATKLADSGEVVKGGWEFDNPDIWLALIKAGGDPIHVELRGWTEKPEVKAYRSQQSGKPVEGTEAVATDYAGLYQSMPDRERLLTQYFRPDIWFAPPPQCNIIFPEEVASLSFSRETLREFTRLQLTTFNSVMGDDVVINQVYFAPQLDQVQSLSSGGLGTAATAFIYPHEKYCGIIPKMEKMNDIAFYSRLSPENLVPHSALTTEEQTDKEALATAASTQIDKWAGRTAAFTYLSYRYDARSLSLAMKFTPRLAVGFPALVIDRTAAEGMTDAERLKDEFSPNHFLGMVRGVTHTVDQSGGNTSVTMSHVRLHKAAMDDLFSETLYGNNGLLAVQVSKENNETTYIDPSIGMDDVEYSWLLRLKQRLAEGMDPDAPEGLLGPNNRRIVGAILLEPTETVITRFIPAGSTVLQDVGRPGWVLDTHPASGDSGDSEHFPFRKVTVVERGETADLLPIEEAIRPPWISDEFSNENIGKYYQSVLGCGSIMDLFTGKDVPKLRSVSGGKFVKLGVEDIVEKLVGQYSRVSEGGYLASTFIREKTRRDFASFEQVIGTQEKPGFYWQACGKYSELKGSMFEWMMGTETTAPSTQLSPAEPNRIDPELDPRAGRWERADTYRAELLQSRGLRG